MSLAKLYSRAQSGIQAPLVTVEVHLSKGLPCLSIVGLPEKAVKESKDRVRSALLNTYFEFPCRRITVNLAPADLPKEGGRFDLPIAIGILVASKQIPNKALTEYEFAGELALSGELCPVRGVLPFAIQTAKAKRKLIIPEQNAAEAALIKDLVVLPAKHITEICAYLCGQKEIAAYDAKAAHENAVSYAIDLSEVYGQMHARRALEIAAAGRHSLLFIGPPGTGKTMLASRLKTILPDMSNEEAMESAVICSISHKGFQIENYKKRPFRSPHHSASSIALVGGGNPPKPGEISLAHQGILFLDELPEFNRHVLEALREPLESGTITISRAAYQNEFPAQFQLIAAMNPCPCGYLGDTQKPCKCTPKQIQQYRSKISGPFLDRIDMMIEVPRLPTHLLVNQQLSKNETSDTVKARVMKAQQKQFARQKMLNSNLTNKAIEKFASLNKPEKLLLEKSIESLNLSARSMHRILRVARTIADLANSENIESTHLAEAIQFRRFKVE